ncbi:Colicin-N [compost metagenome]
MRALDAKTFSDNVKRLGKAFGVVGLSIQGYNVTNKAIAGFKTGNWSPFLLELESIAVGAAAGTVVGPVAGAIMATLLSLLMAPWLATSAAVIAGAISMAAASAYFSPGKVDEINNIIYDSLQ